jgi:hypothetical protein
MEDGMSRKWIVGMSLIAVLAVQSAAWAHGGHTHKVLGAIASIQGNHVEIKTTDGKIAIVMLDHKTSVTRGKAKLDATALKTGDRVSIDYLQDKNVNLAKAVKLGTSPAAATK